MPWRCAQQGSWMIGVWGEVKDLAVDLRTGAVPEQVK